MVPSSTCSVGRHDGAPAGKETLRKQSPFWSYPMIWLLGSKTECRIRTYAVSLIDGISTTKLEDVVVTILVYWAAMGCTGAAKLARLASTIHQ